MECLAMQTKCANWFHLTGQRENDVVLVLLDAFPARLEPENLAQVAANFVTVLHTLRIRRVRRRAHMAYDKCALS